VEWNLVLSIIKNGLELYSSPDRYPNGPTQLSVGEVRSSLLSE